jgi:hypothetical protein
MLAARVDAEHGYRRAWVSCARDALMDEAMHAHAFAHALQSFATFLCWVLADTAAKSDNECFMWCIPES